MADSKVRYPAESTAQAAVLVPVSFTWNGTAVVASTVKGKARAVASVVYVTTGQVRITLKEKHAVILTATASVQTATGTAPTVTAEVGTITPASRTVDIQGLSSALALANPSALLTVNVLILVSASSRDA